MHSIFTKASVQYQLDLPFVIYRKPNSKTLAGIFQKNKELYFSDTLSEQGFVFAPFNGLPIIFPIQVSEIQCDDIYFDTLPRNALVVNNTDSTQQYLFENLVKKALEYIDKGVFNKVVLSRNEIVNLDGFNLEHLFQKILQTYPSAFCYCWYHPSVGLWFGATPENLLHINQNTISTMALAGTQIDTQIQPNNALVIWQEKEKQEQQIVTDYIVYNLKDKVANIQVTEAHTVKAGNLLHLQTNISGFIAPNTNCKTIVQALHPTPAVCGMPSAEAKKFILDNEGYNREFYTGYLGEINYETTTNKKITDIYVNLRCMKIVQNKQAILYAGCGITKSSNPTLEWLETQNKTKTMKQIL